MSHLLYYSKLQDDVQPGADLYLYYRNRRHQSARARAFIDFLLDRFDDVLFVLPLAALYLLLVGLL